MSLFCSQTTNETISYRLQGNYDLSNCRYKKKEYILVFENKMLLHQWSSMPGVPHSEKNVWCTEFENSMDWAWHGLSNTRRLAFFVSTRRVLYYKTRPIGFEQNIVSTNYISMTAWIQDVKQANYDNHSQVINHKNKQKKRTFKANFTDHILQ